MNKRALTTYINLQPIVAEHMYRSRNTRKNRLCRTEHGLLLRDCDGIAAYYEERNRCFVQFRDLELETRGFRDLMIDKILSTGRSIDTFIYLYPRSYALRDFRMHVWIDYSAAQWDEITRLDYAPVLYDFDAIPANA